MEIKAFAIKRAGGKAQPFYYERKIGRNEVLVKITHCGIARGDIQIIDNHWGDTKFPAVPGHEIIGIVEESGAAVRSLKNGDRVGIGYQQEACFECHFCKKGYEQFCPKQKVIAVNCYGGLAEHMIVDYRFAFKLSPKLDSAKSIPLMSAGLTVYSAIIGAMLGKNSMVAVLGVGSLGQLAIQFLRNMGHKVSAFSHSPQKREVIDRLGAEYVDSSSLNSLKRHNRQFDFILSTLIVCFDLDAYLKMLKPQGKLCLVAQPLEKLLMSVGLLYDYAQRSIFGNYIGSRSDMIAMLAFSAKNNIQSDAVIMPFSKMNEAIELVRKRKVPMGIVLEN
jgi:D-arabinose 1-dehydrogenase-like Zn-dependent alcohol dehydrogenase